MKELIEVLVKALVDQPDAVNIEDNMEGTTVVYSVTVAPDDLGKIIGKGGKVADALRTVAKAAAIKEKKNVHVKIVS
ncbi:MAG: KH domain-containing protein [Armatimonadota bacterium]